MRIVLYLVLLNFVDLLVLVLCALAIFFSSPITKHEVAIYGLVIGYTVRRVQSSVDEALVEERKLAERGL